MCGRAPCRPRALLTPTRYRSPALSTGTSPPSVASLELLHQPTLICSKEASCSLLLLGCICPPPCARHATAAPISNPQSSGHASEVGIGAPSGCCLHQHLACGTRKVQQVHSPMENAGGNKFYLRKKGRDVQDTSLANDT
ncbi:unnamed protein product [Urochloa humidicola]